jgi:hypothetical protein
MAEYNTPSQLVFPTDLSRHGYITASSEPNSAPNVPYIEFTAYKWNIDGNAKKDASIFIRKTRRGSVFLPLAEAINDQQSINWETQEGLGAKNLLQLAGKTGLDFIRGFNTSVAKFVEAKKGQTANDLQSLAFGLTNFREWNFTFKLMPKSQRDSQRLAEVIEFFKKQSIANFHGNVIDYPSFFIVKVHFPNGQSGELFDKLLIFKASVITNLSVNYLPEGQSFYRDGAPTVVALDMSLKELERVSRREYNLTPSGGIGSGRR